MTSDGDALFRAICEQPWEDAPRLAYADWLDETGIYNGRHNPPVAQARAAWIRHQIALCRGDAGAIADHAGLTIALSGWQRHWRAELPTFPGVQWGAVFLRRGFVDVVRFTSPDAFGRYADMVFAAAPISTLVVHQVSTTQLPGLLTSPYLRRIESFHPEGPIGDTGGQLVAGCGHLANLKTLWLTDAGMGDPGLMAVARSTTLGRLEAVYFGTNRVTDRGAAALEATTLPALKTIGWYPNPISRAMVRRLRKRFKDDYPGEPPA